MGFFFKLTTNKPKQLTKLQKSKVYKSCIKVKRLKMLHFVVSAIPTSHA